MYAEMLDTLTSKQLCTRAHTQMTYMLCKTRACEGIQVSKFMYTQAYTYIHMQTYDRNHVYDFVHGICVCVCVKVGALVYTHTCIHAKMYT
jgi:hypothetical protein